MKKILAFLIAALVILSALPVMTLTASAAGEGLWTTSRDPDDDDPEEYKPAPGYTYTREGFQTVSYVNQYMDTTPRFRVVSKDPFNMKDNFNMKFRIDQFSYKGDADYDEYISICIWENNEAMAGTTTRGSGFCALLRGAGDGNLQFQSFWTTAKDEQNEIGGNFGLMGTKRVFADCDSQDREYYELDVTYDGGYSIKINGTEAPGMSDISANLETLNPDGDFYVAIILHSYMPNGVADLTIYEVNGHLPTGSDSKEPEENKMKPGERVNPDTVPLNQPAMYFNAAKTSFNKDPFGQNVSLLAQGDNSYRLTSTSRGPFFFRWNIKRSLNVYCEDFPVVTMMVRNYTGSDTGTMYYCAGEVMGAGPNCIANWSLDDAYWEIGDDWYNMIVSDFTDIWEGTIHVVRYDMVGVDPEDSFDVCYIAVFRSEEEARNYADRFIAIQKGEVVTEEGTEEVTENGSEALTEEKTEPVTLPVTEPAETLPADTTAGSAADTEAVSDPSDDKKGCASLIGTSACLILTAVAVAVVLQKKQ